MDAAKKNQIVLTGCIIGWILLSAKIAALTPNLTADTLLEGNTVTACPDQTVVFICQTTGPLAWSSDAYIGTGGNQLPFGLDDIDRVGRRQEIDVGIYVELVSIDPDNRIINSTFHIKASSNSFVTCTATDQSSRSTIYLRILDEPDVPEDPVAIQIRDTRYKRCFIPVVWKNSANSIDARVTHYTINVNQYFMSNQTANLSSAAYYSLLFATKCAENHTVDISATNICGMTGRSTVYRTQRQDQQQCPTDTDTSSCDVTEIPTMPSLTTTQPTTHGYSEQNCGNILLIIASGTMVTTMSYLLGALILL